MKILSSDFKLLLRVTSICALAALAGTAGAQTTVSASDASFARKAAMGGMLEVQLGQVAQTNSSSSEIRDFGAMMVSEHGKAGDKLKAIAATNNITLPTALDAKHQAWVDQLSKLKDSAFDKAYASEMVKDHTKDLTAFKEAAKECTNPDLRNFAKDTIPMVAEHLKKIEAIQDGMK